MKYVRTKDGVILDLLNEVFEKQPLSYKTLGINEIKKADSIEELCDGFVVKDNDEKYIYVTEEKPDFLYFNCNVYGAIWMTGERGEPILKSVAKMNNKGELELL